MPSALVHTHRRPSRPLQSGRGTFGAAPALPKSCTRTRVTNSNAIRRQVEGRGAIPNIPPKANRKWKNCFSPFLYRARNAIERMFCRLKDFRRVATRYDRNAPNFLAAVCIAATVSTGYESVLNRSDLPSTARIRIPMSDVELHERRAERGRKILADISSQRAAEEEAHYRAFAETVQSPNKKYVHRRGPAAAMVSAAIGAPYSGDSCGAAIAAMPSKDGRPSTPRTTFARSPNPILNNASERRGTPDKRRRRFAA